MHVTRTQAREQTVGRLRLGHVLTLAQPVAKTIETGARDAGFLLNAAQPDVVRLAPPLVLTDEQADRFLTALPALLDSAQEQS